MPPKRFGWWVRNKPVWCSSFSFSGSRTRASSHFCARSRSVGTMSRARRIASSYGMREKSAIFPPARENDYPRDGRDQSGADHQCDLRALQPAEPGLERLASEVADTGDQRRPDEHADEVEEGQPPWRDAAAGDDDRPRNAQAVEETHQDDRRRIPAPHQFLYPWRPGSECGVARQDARPVAAPDVEAALVAEERACHCDCDDCRQREMTVGGGDPGQRQHRFTLEEGADEHGGVAELAEEAFHAPRPISRAARRPS